MAAAPDRPNDANVPERSPTAGRSGPARRLAVSIAGGSMIAAGVPLLVLPGPGLLLIGGGLAVLGTEFPAARRGLDRVRNSLDRAGQPRT